MPEIETSSGHLAIITPSLQIRVLWITDHWKHEFISAGKFHSVPLIWSVEGVHDHENPRRPPSPLYQHLDARIEPSGVAIARLTGQSGSHHFETTFAVEEKPNEVEIDVDVDDRNPALVESLTATFLIEASEGKLAVDQVATISWPHPECRLIFEAEPPAKVTASEAGMGTIRIQVHAALDPLMQRHHFRYRWRWISTPARQIWDREA